MSWSGGRGRRPRAVYDFVAGGGDDEVTLADNRGAFTRVKLVPRTLRDVGAIDTSTTLLGLDLRAPMLVAPMALQCLLHDEGECGMARAAQDAGLGMVLSTAATQTIEEVLAAARPMWFQLYMQQDRSITADLVHRAAAAGASAICLTVDTPVPGLRRKDIVNAFTSIRGIRYACLEPYTASAGSGNPYGVALNRSATWDAVGWLRSLSDLPVVVKGILSPDDAHLAMEQGAAGVVVSNHGGRQLNNVPATLDVLPEIVDAVGVRGAVVFDSGIRHATDIAVALCLGARAVLIGRPALWALAYGGSAGVRRYLDGLVKELERTMASSARARSASSTARSSAPRGSRLPQRGNA